MTAPLVLSMSSIALYRRCPRAFKHAYIDRYIPKRRSEAADLGTAFHHIVAEAAGSGIEMVKRGAEMWDVALAYLKERPLPANIIYVEEPMYRRILRNTWLRTTFDLVYCDEDGWVVGRDYKTFEKAPTYDQDLDFQGRLYIAALQRQFPDKNVRFEYEYVRRVVPGTANSKGVWRKDECYIRQPVVISRREADEVWAETQEWARRILTDRRTGKFPRAGTRKEFGSPCMGCFQSDICKTEMQHGPLDEQDFEFFVEGIADELVLPKGLK